MSREIDFIALKSKAHVRKRYDKLLAEYIKKPSPGLGNVLLRLERSLKITIDYPTKEKIKEIREFFGVKTHARAAKLTYVSKSTWTRWEAGSSRMRPEFLQRFSAEVCKLFDPVKDLLEYLNSDR